MRHYAFLVTIASIAIIISLWVAFNQPPATAAVPGIELGAPLTGQNAFEFVGRADQSGSNFVGYGYMTSVYGLTQTLVFTNPVVNSEASAHLTYYGTSTLSAESIISNVFILDSVGTVVYYYNYTPTATFADPHSFATGIPILTETVHYQDIWNVQTPNVGIATGNFEVMQTALTPFTINGQTYHIGRVGLTGRGFSAGEATRTNPITPILFVVHSGYEMVTGIPGQVVFIPTVQLN